MTIKIQCPCGVKYAFEIESPDQRVKFVCPQCGQDSSAALTQIIQQQIAEQGGAASGELIVPNAGLPSAPPTGTNIEPAPAAPKPRVHITLPPEKKSGLEPAGTSSLHLNKAEPEPQSSPPAEANAARTEPAEAAPDQTCLKHAGEAIVSACVVCKRPLCAKCMELFGYVCSAYCHAQAERLHIPIPVYGQQKALVEANYWRKVRWIALSAMGLVLVLLGLWFWYANFLAHPKLVFSLTLPAAGYHESECRLVGADQAVVRHGNKLTRYDLKKKAQVWSAQLLDKKQIEEASARELAERKAWAEKWKAEMAKVKKTGRYVDEDGDEVPLPKKMAEAPPLSDEEQLQNLSKYVEEDLLSKIKLHLDGNELWVIFPNALAHINWETGKPDKEIHVPEKVKHVEARDQAFLFISQTDTGREIFTHVTLPGGEVTTEKGPEPAPSPEKLVSTKTTATGPGRTGTNALKTASKAAASKTVAGKGTVPDKIARVVANTPSADSEPRPDDEFRDPSGTRYVFAGPNVARLSVKLMEKKVVAYAAMKEAPKVSELDKGVSAANAVAAMNEIVNEWEKDRTGGKRMEDESRYAVTIQRLLAQGVPEWTGEVSGPPELFPLKTVDVLVAGKTLTVFDKSNKKLWEGKLAYPIAAHFDMEGALWQLADVDNNTPCVEREQRLYFYDQGVLTAYDLASGNAHWRITSVGINKLHFDRQGMLYVVTTSAGVDTLQFSQQVDLNRKIVPVILKVDPRNGKILWRVNQTGEKVIITDKFLYTVESDASRTDPLRMMPGGGSHLGIYRLDPANGRELWHHFEKRAAFDTDFQKTTILVLFNNEMEVLRFLSL